MILRYLPGFTVLAEGYPYKIQHHIMIIHMIIRMIIHCMNYKLLSNYENSIHIGPGMAIVYTTFLTSGKNRGSVFDVHSVLTATVYYSIT